MRNERGFMDFNILTAIISDTLETLHEYDLHISQEWVNGIEERINCAYEGRYGRFDLISNTTSLFMWV